MIDLLIMISSCTALAYVIDSWKKVDGSAYISIKERPQSKIIYWVILVWAILFAGLRTKYNDTSTYWSGFLKIDTNITFKNIFASYGGFELFEKVIKKYISTNPQVFIFLSSLICCYLTLTFIKKHTENFAESIFLFFIIDFLFITAGIKQAMAISIALYAIEACLEKKYFKFGLLLLLAMLFHPYIICLACIPFLRDEAWGKKTILWLIVFALAFINLDKLFELIAAVGKDYSQDDFDSHTINPFRVLVEAVPVAISILYRDKLRKENDEFLNLGINMQAISFVFIFLGLFYNPIYLGRMATYFTAISAITLPKMLHVAFKGDRYCKVMTLGYYCFFGLYFLLDLTSLGSISLLYDRFQHANIFDLFK